MATATVAGTHLYTRSTINWLVEEANYRGIRIIPYFELVGHDALGGAVPQIMWCNGKNVGVPVDTDLCSSDPINPTPATTPCVLTAGLRLAAPAAP